MPDAKITPRDWYKIRPASLGADPSGTSADIMIYDAIGGFWGIGASDIVAAIAGLTVDKINLYVNSPGGDVYDALAIMNALERHPATVTATVDGLAASAASFLITAADEIVMGRGAELMIHDPWMIVLGNAAELTSAAASLDKTAEDMAAIYARRAGGDPADWRAVMKSETWYSALEAVAAGLADRTTLDGDGAEAAARHAPTFATFGYRFQDRRHAPAPQHPTRQETPAMAETSTTTTEPTPAAPAAPVAALPARETMPAVPAGLEVHEPIPYRFDGHRGAHSLLGDLVARANGASVDAAVRLEKFCQTMAANIGTGNVDELNPTPSRPELFVPNLYYSRPLWNSVSTGPLDAITGFIIPQFNAASGLVADHTEGTEPDDGSFSTKSKTITPTALSGRVTLNREVVDQGGNPQVDALIWNEMLASYYWNLEVAIRASLAAANAAGEVNLSTTAADAALVNKLKAEFSAKQFVAGGDRFTRFVADPVLYAALVGAKDGNDRPLLPVLGPTNSDGSARASYESVQVGAKTVTPAAALAFAANSAIGAANAQLSYLFVPESVYAWASAPARLDFQYQVSSVVIGIWGYKATAVTRNTDVIPFDMSATDTDA